MNQDAAVPAVPGRSGSALDADGYIVVPTGLPSSILEAVVDDIWRHAGATPGDPATWYQPAVIRPRPGMVEMYHYQSMWNVRQHPAVYRIFRDLHRRDELWVSIDRVAFKPPVRSGQPDYDQPGFIHWDTDINRYPDIPFRLQGVLALEDTSADMGGFQCVPSIYRDQQRFLDERSKTGPVPRAPDIGDHPIVKVPLAAGDLVIWKTTLLHGNGRNSAQRPRLAQYLTMNPLPPAREQRETLRRNRIMSWSACAPPDGDAFPGDPRCIEEQRGEPASLSQLGRRLLGLDEWPGCQPAGMSGPAGLRGRRPLGAAVPASLTPRCRPGLRGVTISLMRVQRFGAHITSDSNGRAVIAVPFDPDETWGAKAYHPVSGTIHPVAGTTCGRRLRGRITPDGSQWVFTINPMWMRDTGVAAGDEVIVELEPEGPQRGDLADDIASALEASPAAAAFFDTLAQFYRKAYLRWIAATTRRPELRAARIAEVVGLLEAGIKERPRA